MHRLRSTYDEQEHVQQFGTSEDDDDDEEEEETEREEQDDDSTEDGDELGQMDSNKFTNMAQRISSLKNQGRHRNDLKLKIPATPVNLNQVNGYGHGTFDGEMGVDRTRDYLNMDPVQEGKNERGKKFRKLRIQHFPSRLQTASPSCGNDSATRTTPIRLVAVPLATAYRT